MARRASAQVRTALDLSAGAMTVDALLTQVLYVERVIELLVLETDLAP